MKINLVLVLLSTLMALAVLYVNYLANSLPINGLNTGEVSALFPNLFIPAGFTFAIWGLIYLLQTVWVSSLVYQWFGTQELQVSHRFMLWFLLLCASNMLWILLWHHLQIAWSALLLFIMLLALIQMFLIIQESIVLPKKINLIAFFVSVYLAWVCIAFMANVSAFLYAKEWSGFGLEPSFWYYMLVFLGTILGVFFIAYFKNFAFGLVLVWSFYGLYARHKVDEVSLSYATIFGLGVLIITMSIVWGKRLMNKDIAILN